MAEGADTMGHAMVWGGREWTTMDITTPVRGSKTAVFKGVWTAMDVYGREIGGEGGSHIKHQKWRISARLLNGMRQFSM